jgi:hypothetical protein
MPIARAITTECPWAMSMTITSTPARMSSAARLEIVPPANRSADAQPSQCVARGERQMPLGHQVRR